jgi:hypothetical protein
MALYFTDQDIQNYLETKPTFDESPTVGVGAVSPTRTSVSKIAPIQELAPKTKVSQETNIDTIAQRFVLAGPGGGVSGIPEYQSNLKEIWNGFRQGTATVVDSIDAVVNLVSKATGLEKGGAFEKLKTYIEPRPEELADQNFGASLLRAIGAAGPIIAEFGLGTKGAGIALKAAKLPTAIGGIGLAPVAAFGAIEGVTTAGKGGTLEETAKATGKGVILGTALGAASKLKPIIQAPAVGGVFGTMASLEGANAQDIAIQSLVGLGLGAHGAWKSAKGINSMREYLATHGYEPETITKMGMSKLRTEYTKTIKQNMVDYLSKRGTSVEEALKMSDEDLETTFRQRVAEESIKTKEDTEKVTAAYKAAPEEVKIKSKEKYIAFLTEKGFNADVLQNVSNAGLSKLSMLPDPRLYNIDPVTGKIEELKTKKAQKIRKEVGKSKEELQKTISTATSQADKEKAQAVSAKKEVDTARIIREVEEAAAKERAQGIVKEEAGIDPVVKQKMQQAAIELQDDWAIDNEGPPKITVDIFEATRQKYSIPDTERDSFARYLQGNGIDLVKKGGIEEADISKFVDKAVVEEKVPTEEEVPIPSRIRRAFKEKTKGLISEEQWNIATPQQKEAIVDLINKYYDRIDRILGSNRKVEQWKKLQREGGYKGGRPPANILSKEWMIKLRNQATAARNSLRAYLNREGIRLAIEGKEGIGEGVEKGPKPKAAILKFSKSTKKVLSKYGWSDSSLNELTAQEDIKLLLKNKLGPNDVNIDKYGRIERPDVKIAKTRELDLLNLINKGIDDEVLRNMGTPVYGQDEIDAARAKVSHVVTKEQPTIPKEVKKTQEKTLPKKKGLIKTLADAEMVFDKYKDMTLEGEEPGAAENIAIKRIQLKRALEDFVGKKNLSDEQLEIELTKLAQKEASGVIKKGTTEKPSVGGEKEVEGKFVYEFEKLTPDKQQALLDLGWSEESLKKIENPKYFDQILTKGNPLTPDYASITPTGKVFVFGEASPEAGYGEKVRKDVARLVGEESIITDPKALEEELARVGVAPKSDTGEKNPDELVAKAYERGRKPSAYDEAEADFQRASDRIYEQSNQIAQLELAIKDPKTDPKLKDLYTESLVIMKDEFPKILSEYEVLKQTYSDIAESMGIKKESYMGPVVGETKVEGSKWLDDGTGGLIVSEGGHGVDRFYLLQGPEGQPSKADSTGNKIGAEARLIKNEANPEKLELQVFKSSSGINPNLEDELLKAIINKYMAFGKQKMRSVSQVPGVADDVWARRGDIETEIRKSASKEDLKHNLVENVENNNRLHRYITYVTRLGRGIKEWKESYSKRADLLEQLSLLKQAADPQQFDPERFKSEVFPEHERMLGLIELLGDPTASKIPIIRYIAQKVSQAELQVQFLTNHYLNHLKTTFEPIFGKHPELQKEFWEHVHRVKTSTDPTIIDAYTKYRAYKEDVANVLKLRERGMYLDEYGTIRYDMNKIWDIMKQPFKLADSYEELGDSVKAALSNDSFAQAKFLCDTYKTWDQVPRPSQDWLQQNLFNFQGVWSNWAYLPEFIQRAIPKKFFVESMQARTAGDAFKAALKYDFFDMERGYALSMVKGALMNEALTEIRPLINSLPNASKFGSVRNYLERYIKAVAGQKPTLLDPLWNSMANRVNETLQANIVPLYVPTTVSREYIPLLYRGLLGPDTALRNLTQSIYTMAKSGPKPMLQGVLRYVDEARKKTPEFKQFEEMINLPDEFLEISRPIIPVGESRSILDKIRYVNHKITKIALSPMRFTEHVNKGIAYFAGLEEAAAKGYNLNEAHIVGTAKASQLFPALELTEGQYKALRSMYETQFGYTSSHTSPYLQGAGMKMFTPFWSFPIKTAQLMWNSALINPVGKKTVLGKSDNAWLRFMALTGFMATAPVITANLFGVDTKNIWGKGVFPMTIYPAWMQAIGKVFTMVGSDPGDFMDRERASNYMLQFVGQMTIPNFRWGSKVYRDSMNAERGYREYGREMRPVVETSWLDEMGDIMGFPPAKFRDAREAMAEYKDAKFKNMIRKHYYLYKAVDAMEDKDYNKALKLIKEVKTEYNIDITPTEIQQAIGKKKEDIWLATKTGAPKSLRTKPEFQQKMIESRGRFVPSRAKSYGTMPMWSSLSETISQTGGGEATISLEE